MNPFSKPLPHMEYLSVSRIGCFKECPRRFRFKYIDGVEPTEKSDNLLRGSSMHKAFEMLARGAEWRDVAEAVLAFYLDIPEGRVKAYTALGMVYAYRRHYAMDEFEPLAAEEKMYLPIYNADGNASTRFGVLMILDKFVQSRRTKYLHIMDHKTCMQDIGPGSDYRQKLNLDPQISMYIMGAREAGVDIHSFIYDMIRMPQIRPRQVTKAEQKMLQETGEWFGQPVDDPTVTVETAEMFCWRLVHHVGEDTEKYFQRVEVARTDRDLEEFKHELWDDQKVIAAAMNTGRYPANPNSCLFPYKCDYFGPCTAGLRDLSTPPEGYHKKEAEQ